VAELLEAAACVIAEVGYDATTMKAIALRAGASIGAVYQYFPNKAAVVRALRTEYGNEMEASWAPLTQETAHLGLAELVDRIFAVLIDIMGRRPAYVPLLSAPQEYSRDPAARNRLREQFATLFRKRRPALTPQDAFRIANVALQVIRGLHPLYAEAKPRERQQVLQEFKLVLTAYLVARLEPDD
jgi:AcrR family transcriptional regulator